MHTEIHRIPGHDVHEHVLSVPLDHAGMQAGTIEVFSREIVRDGGADRPRLLWFQGGPGNRANRPSSISGWLDRALEDYRVVLLDQRGTGRSTPADRQTLANVGGAQEQATYLAHFRADAIVAAAAVLRQALDEGAWTALGPSCGGVIPNSGARRRRRGGRR